MMALSVRSLRSLTRPTYRLAAWFPISVSAAV